MGFDMLQEIELEIGINNIEDIFEYSLNILCSDSMLILQNNSKVLKYLTNEDLSHELDMLVVSLNMAIKRKKIELFKNIIFTLEAQEHKLAALEIKYFDEHAILLRTDMLKLLNAALNEHAIEKTDCEKLLAIFNRTIELSPTNAAFALHTALELGEYDFVQHFLCFKGMTDEFISQIHKRYLDNFGMSIAQDCAVFEKNLVKKSVFQFV